MSRELSTKKDIIKACAIKSEFTEEQFEEYYKFFLDRMVRLMNDPETLSVRISKYFGDLYLRLRAARKGFYLSKEKGYEISELTKSNYDKLDIYLERIRDRKTFIYFKKNYLNSKFAEGLTREELEEKQNKVYEKRRKDGPNKNDR